MFVIVVNVQQFQSILVSCLSQFLSSGVCLKQVMQDRHARISWPPEGGQSNAQKKGNIRAEN